VAGEYIWTEVVAVHAETLHVRLGNNPWPTPVARDRVFTHVPESSPAERIRGLHRRRDEREHHPRPAEPVPFKPRVLSLRRAKVAELTLSGLDLRACHFVGAHGLDELRLERAQFSTPPAGWHTTPAGWRARWTRRATVAEEQLWRRERADRLKLVHPSTERSGTPACEYRT
jgi:hypothetical protein